MKGGVLLVVAGLWVGFQVLGGNALDRLGVLGDAPTSSPTAPVTTPEGGESTGFLIPTPQPPASIAAPYRGLTPSTRP